MSFISAYASFEAESGLITPSIVLINTSDTLATVTGAGYLTGKTLNPVYNTSATAVFANGQEALVKTSDMGMVKLNVFDDGAGNFSLVPLTSVITNPPASSASTLSLGTAYHNTLGYNVMLAVYLSITSAVGASILLGVGSTNSPSQQTIYPSLTLAVLGIITIPILLPANYYAKLSTSGTITASIAGQIAMPI